MIRVYQGRVEEEEYLEYEDLFKALDKEAPQKHLSLLIPEEGGPSFVTYYYEQHEPREMSWNADINSAINLGLRAVAAPDNLCILNRLRCQLNGQEVMYIDKTKRGLARFTAPPRLSLKAEAHSEDKQSINRKSSALTNVFIDLGNVAEFERVKIHGESLSAATGKGLWGTIKRHAVDYCLRLNRNRLKDKDR